MNIVLPGGSSHRGRNCNIVIHEPDDISGSKEGHIKERQSAMASGGQCMCPPTGRESLSEKRTHPKQSLLASKDASVHTVITADCAPVT